MKASKWLVYASLISAAPASGSAAPDPVADALASLNSASDEAARSYWSKNADASLAQGINEETNRRLSKLLFAKYSFGVCVGFVPRADYAAWDAKLAEIVKPPLTDEHREIIRHSMAKMSFETSASPRVRAMNSDERKSYCAIELEAVRKFIDAI